MAQDKNAHVRRLILKSKIYEVWKPRWHRLWIWQLWRRSDPSPPPDEVEPEETTAETTAQAKRAHRRTKECTEISQRYEYRRAFSEVKLLEAMQYLKLQDHTTYNCITAGDVDSLSYLKVVLNQHDLD